MPFDHDQVVTAQFQQLAAARAKALGDYEASRASMMIVRERWRRPIASLMPMRGSSPSIASRKTSSPTSSTRRRGPSRSTRAFGRGKIRGPCRADRSQGSAAAHLRRARGNMPAIKTDSRRFAGQRQL